jgi:hypothetical protein
MPTGLSKVNLYEKRLLERTAIKDHFLDFLVATIDEVSAAVYQGEAGILDSSPISISSSANDTFTLGISVASRCLVQDGQIIDLAGLAAAFLTDVPFENDNGQTYGVGIKFAEVPDGIETNPRTEDPEYPRLKQTYGELDHPDSVTDNTTYIRVVVNSITGAGSGEDHSGRTCRVWLDDPVSQIESVAYWEGTVQFSTPNNYVDIPYTSPDGPLGQDTGVSPPSTTASDYWVFIEGPTWRDTANKNLQTDSDYAFIGLIAGNGPAATPVSFDISGQHRIFLITLQKAYDGIGFGAGRDILVADGAVELNTDAGGAGDQEGTTLRVDSLADAVGSGVLSLGQMIMMKPTDYAGAFIAARVLEHSTVVTAEMAATTDGADHVSVSAPLDFTTGNVVEGDLALLRGFSTDKGLFRIAAIAATQLTLGTLHTGAAPVFHSEGGTLTILRPMFASLGSYWDTAGQNRDNTFRGHNEVTSGTVVRIFPHESLNALSILDDAAAAIAYWHKTGARYTDMTGQDMIVPVYPFQRLVGGNGQESLNIHPNGRIVRTGHFRDEFHYHSTRWTGNADCPLHYRCIADAAGTHKPADVTTYGALAASGAMVQIADGGGGNSSEFWAGQGLSRGQTYTPVLHDGTSEPLGLHIVFRLSVEMGIDSRVRVGFSEAGTPHYLLFDPANSEAGLGAPTNNWIWFDGLLTYTEIANSAPVADRYQMVHFWLPATGDAEVWITGMSSPVTILGTSVDTWVIPYLQTLDDQVGPSEVTTFLDLLEFWFDRLLWPQ